MIAEKGPQTLKKLPQEQELVYQWLRQLINKDKNLLKSKDYAMDNIANRTI